jgi:hypothetical protein
VTSPGGKPVAQVSANRARHGGLLEKLRRELAQIDDVTIKVDIDEEHLRRQLEEIDDITVKVKFDVDNLQDDINRATAGAKASAVDVPADLDDANLKRQLRDLGDNVDPVEIRANLDQAGFEAEIARVRAELEALDAQEASPEVILRSTDLKAELRALKAELAALSAQEIDVKVTADGIQEVLGDVTRVRIDLAAASRDPVAFKLELEAADLQGELAVVLAELEALDGKTVTPTSRLRPT